MDIVGRLSAKPDVEIPLSIERRSASDMIVLSVSNETIRPHSAAPTRRAACHSASQGPCRTTPSPGYYPGDVTPLPGAGSIETAPDPGGTGNASAAPSITV